MSTAGKSKLEVVADAVHTIIHCWDDWDSHAREAEQAAQNPDAWFAEMEPQIAAVVEGAIDEATQWSQKANTELLTQLQRLQKLERQL